MIVIDYVLNLCKQIVNDKAINYQEIKHLLERHKNDSSKLIVLFNQYKITQFVNHYLSTQAANEFAEFNHQLKATCQRRVNRSIFQLTETQRVATAFAKHKIPLISYKGLTFAQQFYGKINLRSSVDIDFAISKQQLSKIGEVMLSLGYREAKGENNYQNLKKTRGYYIDYSWLLYNENNQPICNVEFHWRATATALYVPLIFDEIFEKQTILKVQNQAIRTFQPVYQALLVIIHHGIVDGWGKLRHLIDLAQIDKTLTAQQWETLTHLTKKYKVYKAFMVGCFIGEQLLNYNFANKTTKQAVAKLGTKMIEQIKKDQLSEKWSQQPIKLFYYLQMREGLGLQLKSMQQFITYGLRELMFKLRKLG